MTYHSSPFWAACLWCWEWNSESWDMIGLLSPFTSLFSVLSVLALGSTHLICTTPRILQVALEKQLRLTLSMTKLQMWQHLCVRVQLESQLFSQQGDPYRILPPASLTGPPSTAPLPRTIRIIQNLIQNLIRIIPKF